MRELKLTQINAYTVAVDLIRNAWVVILAFLTGFLGVQTYYGYVYEPTYQSSMTVAVNVRDAKGYIASNITKTVEIAGIFHNVFKSDVMEKIIEADVDGFDPANISADVVPETNLINITAVSPSPVDSYKTLRAVLENYEGVFVENVFRDIYISVLAPPTVPVSPNNAVQTSRKALYGGILLMLLAAAAIFALSFLRDTVKQESDVETFVDGKLFGTLPHEKSSGSVLKKKNETSERFLISNPLCSYQFSEGVNRIATKIEYLKKSRSAKTFLITSVDEHEGKTTVSANTALNLALKGFRVLLIDADLRRPAVYKNFENVDFDGTNELGGYLLDKNTLESAFRLDEASGLRILGGKNSYQYAFELLNGKRFRKMIKRIYDAYDFIIIDSPPMSLTADAESVLDIIDVSLLVVRQDRTFIAQINDTIDDLTAGGAYFAGCILNDYRTLPKSPLAQKLSGKHGGEYGGYYYSSN